MVLALHRPNRDPEDRRDLALAEVFEVPQDDNGPLLGGQGTQGAGRVDARYGFPVPAVARVTRARLSVSAREMAHRVNACR